MFCAKSHMHRYHRSIKKFTCKVIIKCPRVPNVFYNLISLLCSLGIIWNFNVLYGTCLCCIIQSITVKGPVSIICIVLQDGVTTSPPAVSSNTSLSGGNVVVDLAAWLAGRVPHQYWRRLAGAPAPIPDSATPDALPTRDYHLAHKYLTKWRERVSVKAFSYWQFLSEIEHDVSGELVNKKRT